MPKRLAMVLTVLFTLGVGSMWGATFTTTTSGGFNNGTKTLDGITVTIAKGSGTAPSWQSGHVRVYQGNTISFSSTSSIVSITMTATSSSYAKEFTASTGNFSTSGSTMSWEGSANSLTLTLPSGSAQARITQIVVTVKTGCTGTKLGTPVVTATPSDRQVILSWPNVSNADSYQLKWSGGDWAAATSPVTKTGLTNGMAYTYQVKAIGNGSTYCDGDASEEASATPNVFYTVTWMKNGIAHATTQVAGGSKPTFPDTPESCDDTSNSFYGWATASWSGKIDNISEKTIYTSANNMPAVNGAVTYHAVFATKGAGGGTAFDGTSGGDFKIYALVGEEKKYLKGTGDKILPVGESDATEYTFTKISDGVFSIKTGTTYLTYASGTNLGTSNSAYSWTISKGTKGSWRIASAANSSRGIVYRASTYNQFGGYATSNITTNGTEYYDVEIGGGSSVSYSGYITTCATKTSVTLNPNGGKFTSTTDGWIQNGDKLTKQVDGSVTLPTPTQTGYDFKGWYDAASDGDKIADGGEDYTPSEDIVLYAQWDPITYIITLNPGSGICDNNTVSGTCSEGVKLPTASPSNACTEEGWTFAGWATASVNETTTVPTTLYDANQTYNPTTNIELYAVYMKQTFTLSIVYNSTTYYVGEYESSKSILTAETDVNNAMDFRIVDGQYLRCESGYISHNSASSTNISCYLSKDGNVFPWTITENTGTISFQSTKAEGNVRYLGYNYNDGNPRFAVYVESYAHNLTKTTTTTYTSNPSCVPTYSLTNIIYPSAEYGNISPETVDGIPENTSISTSNNIYTVNGTTVTAIPAAATAQYTYAFSSWSNLPATVTADATVTANFTRTINKYTITWKNGDDILETDTDVEYGATPTYNGDKPKKEQDEIYTYEFTGWTPELADVTGDQIYTATYNQIKRQYTVIWFVNGMQVHTEQVDAGNEITPPTVNSIPCGAVIAGWTDAEGGNYVHKTSTLHVGATPSIEIRSNKIFYAVFADYGQQ